MSPTPLKTGQGLVAHGLGAALRRWLTYARIVAVTAAVMSVTSILHQVPAPSRDLAGVYALARFKLWIAEGRPVAPTISLQTPDGPVLIPAKIIARSPGFQAAGRDVAVSAVAGALAGVLLGGAQNQVPAALLRDGDAVGVQLVEGIAILRLLELQRLVLGRLLTPQINLRDRDRHSSLARSESIALHVSAREDIPLKDYQ